MMLSMCVAPPQQAPVSATGTFYEVKSSGIWRDVSLSKEGRVKLREMGGEGRALHNP